MAKRASSKAGAGTIRCTATVMRPAPGESTRGATWTFLRLPPAASARLPSRGQVAVEGTLHGSQFQATLEPDGEGGHWLKVDRKLREAAGVPISAPATAGVNPTLVVSLDGPLGP